MKDSKKLEWKKHIQEYGYVKTDLDYKSVIIEENQAEFMSLVNSINIEEIEPEEENLKANQEKNERVKPSWNSFDEDIRQKAKKLYREISKRAHPDKDPSGVFSDLFSEVSIAYENCRLFDIFIFCDILGIEYEVSEKELSMLRFEIEEKRKNIEQIEKSFIYSWISTDNQKLRDILVKQFARVTKGK